MIPRKMEFALLSAIVVLSACGESDVGMERGGNCGGKTCLAHQTYIEEACVDLCGDKVCEVNETCVNGTCMVLVEPCKGECTESQDCVDNQCVDLCGGAGGVLCTEDQICQDGRCVDLCGGKGGRLCTGEETCVEGVCTLPEVKPCDGRCLEHQVCEDNLCIDLCGGEKGKVCAEDENCIDGECKKIEVGPVDPCNGACKENQVCRDGVCEDIDPCSNKYCPEGTKCIAGVCESTDPCTKMSCDEGYRCVADGDKASCVEIDPCENISCIVEGQICFKGLCVDSACIVEGAEMVCPEGQMCSKGECIDDGCLEAGCTGEGIICVKGSCVEEACMDKDPDTGAYSHKVCSEGRTCKGGECIDNECLDVECEGEGIVCSKGDCIPAACVGVECREGKYCTDEGKCDFVTKPDIFYELMDDSSDESGDTATISLKINNMPDADVRLECTITTSSPNPEVVSNCDEIVFNSENWENVQDLMLMGVPDSMIDGDQKFTVDIKTVSEEEEFNGLTLTVKDLVNKDMDKAEYIFTIPDVVIQTVEDGSSSSFMVALSSKPTADVTIDLASSNDKEGVLDITSLTFTPDNWDQPQTVTVSGVDDQIADGNQNYKIIFSNPSSTDKNWSSVIPEPLEAVNVDNDKPGITVSPLSFNLVEDDDEHGVPLMIRLNTEPKAPVTMKLEISDDTEVKADIVEFEITKDNWESGQPVMLVGIADHMIDGDIPWTINVSSVSEDKDYDAHRETISGKTIDVDKGGMVTSLSDSAIVLEGNSKPVNITVALNSIPTSNVSVKVDVEDTTEISVSSASLTFTPENWNVPQVIAVSSVDDYLVDQNVYSMVTLTSTSDDKNFNDTKPIQFVTVDNDKAGFNIVSTPGSYAENSGQTIQVKVSLTAQPTETVNVTASSSDASELAVQSNANISFNASNWNVPQTVTLVVVDDDVADGVQTANITFKMTSADENFHYRFGESAIYTIVDNESATVVLTVDKNELRTDAASTTAYVKLGSAPLSNVTVTLTSSRPDALQLGKTSFTFTPGNWDAKQSFKVSADFSKVSAVVSTETISGIASGGGIYSGVSSNTLSIGLYAINKITTIEPSGTTCVNKSMTLPAGKYKLEVWGASGGYSAHSTSGGGKGGYTTGVLNLKKATPVYIHLGTQGVPASSGYTPPGGCGGGGNGYSGSYYQDSGSGGGSTDIRLGSDSLYARVIVAGGGGGAGCSSTTGGHGGGLTAIAAIDPNTSYGGPGGPGTQTSGGAGGTNSTAGGFGYAGKSGTTPAWGGGGGGGGWYGGGGGGNMSGGGGAGGGGSSYYYSTATVGSYPSGCLLTSDHYLTSYQTIAGNATMTSPLGSTETGHTGHGYAKITILE